MFNPILNTFISVIDCGSFTKAAEQLNISTTAIMKQMNTLEKHLNLKLIDRTPTGVRYTQAGKIIYRDAKFIIDYSKKSITEAKAAASDDGIVFRAGTSKLAPARAFMDLWYQVSPDFPENKLQLVSFEDDTQGLLPEIKKRPAGTLVPFSQYAVSSKLGQADAACMEGKHLEKWWKKQNVKQEEKTE